jgi:hypothetical protein
MDVWIFVYHDRRSVSDVVTNPPRFALPTTNQAIVSDVVEKTGMPMRDQGD